jgi:nucleoside 2-deoxyribosyltransferase
MADEMNNAYEKAIRPGIEFLEKNETEPRFKALRIDNKEHTNDINDEIIGEIRRSRFMVCDLTSYRGGVYFEAGFAYGLGLEVIYTCREDWIRSELLRDETAKEISVLYDTNKRQISIRKEGIHFDLEHRNRIAWTEKDLETFASKLTNRIKAVVS